MVSNSQIGVLFKDGARKGKSNTMEIQDCGSKTVLVGYGWAVYGERDKKTGMIQYHDGWRGYSRTTSKQLGQTSLKSERPTGKRPELKDDAYSSCRRLQRGQY